MDADPLVSFVIPARNEAAYLQETLASVQALDTTYEYELIVADGASTDGTAAIGHEYGATVIEGPEDGIAAGRNRGAECASGEWLAFVDADTKLRADYLTTMLRFVEDEGLAAASSYCRMTGPLRAKLMQATINRIFPRLQYPVLPGFNCFVRRSVFRDAGGFPNVPNEDTAFSRRLARDHPTGYCPRVLVESSGRRIADDGLTGTAVHYLRKDLERVRRSRAGTNR